MPNSLRDSQHPPPRPSLQLGREIVFCAMDDLGLATEDQVILAWLQAEIDSVGFQQYLAGEPANPVYLAQALKAARSPNLRDADQNELRRRIVVRTHGFGVGIKSFEGLANDIHWRRMRLTAHEVGEMLYANGHAAWTTLAPVTRKVAEGASNIGHVFTGDLTNMLVLALALRISDSHPMPKLPEDRKSTRLNSSHWRISYAVFCLKK